MIFKVRLFKRVKQQTQIRSVRVVRAVALASLYAVSLTAGTMTIDTSNIYNAIILGNLNASGGDVEGRLLVGGNASFSGAYSVGNATFGTQLPNSASRDDLIVFGNITTGSRWPVNANTVYGGTFTYTGNQQPGSPTGLSHNSAGATDIHMSNFSVDLSNGNVVAAGSGWTLGNLTNLLGNMSSGYGSMASGGAVSVIKNAGSLQLTGDSSTLDVFNVSAADWSGATSQVIHAPSGATVVVNLLGSAVNVSGGSMLLQGVDANHVVFNLPDATIFSSSGYDWSGSILAPNAAATLSGGGMSGVGVFGSASQNNGWQFKNSAFKGAIPIPTAATPEPASIVLLGGGMVAIALRIRRRSKSKE